MKQLFSISMLAAIMMQTLSTLLIIADYEINKNYITQNFCENQNKPQMHCKGQCYLSKQLEKHEKNENSPQKPLKEKNDIQLFFPWKDFSFTDYKIEKNNYSPYLEKELTPPISSAFHPPKC